MLEDILNLFMAKLILDVPPFRKRNLENMRTYDSHPFVIRKLTTKRCKINKDGKKPKTVAILQANIKVASFFKHIILRDIKQF